MVTKKKMITLNIFLAEKKYSKNDFTFFLSKACKEYPITGIKGMTGACFIKEKKENAPKWKDFIEGIVGQKVDDLITKSSSAALLVKSKGRIFAITFGYGRCLIEQSYFVSDFGIKSAH
ncbi:TIGR04141 family sporadically distributed protein [Klebsiella pneumoniae]